MTKFNPEKKENLTYGDTLKPAMEITDPEDAKQYLNEYATWLQEKAKLFSINEAIEMAKNNLRYFCGYYDNETAKRVFKLFNINN